MGFIQDWIFGKEITYNDNRIGELTARIRNKKKTDCVWTGTYLIPGQKAETVIILEGDSNTPFSSQIKGIYALLDNIQDINHKVEEYWRNQPIVKQSFTADWMDRYYIEGISPWEIEDNSFEISYEPYDKNDSSYIALIWKDQEIREVEIK
ncbi:hypothetical protein [Parabacteroides sp. FAFU027]|uniref:hypothetical protein n=1 Tax=Parabacteroides sp. FAFU027 TaxID=2922715 RepID=UPI001FAF84B1|nr:hypothetical protein [Parabacteroides sp. FAFU027]